MAAYETTRTMGHGHAFSGRLSLSIHNLFAGVIAWNDARMTRNALSKLSDRELADVGLSRGDIENLH